MNRTQGFGSPSTIGILQGGIRSPYNVFGAHTHNLIGGLYTLDSGSRRATHTIPHDAPFSSLAYNDDGTILAAGTNSGRVVFYDVRGKPQPLTILRAYNSSEVGNLTPFFSLVGVCKYLLS